MRFQRGNIWLKSGREKSPLPPFAKGGDRGDFETRSLTCTLYFFERNLVLRLGACLCLTSFQGIMSLGL